MKTKSMTQFCKATALRLIVVAMVASVAMGQGNLRRLSGSVPGLVSTAQDLGPEDPSQQIAVSVWLKRHNDAAFQQLLRQMYTQGSPNYHRWLTMDQYMATFGPTSSEVAGVSDFLTANNLQVTEVDKHNHYVIAEGTIADVQNAFHVQIDQFSLHGETFRANTSDAAIDGPVGDLVGTVLGLDNIALEPQIRRATNPSTGQSFAPVPLEDAPTSFTSSCWTGDAVLFETPFWTYPIALYSGSQYGSAKNSPECGYTPADLWRGYGLNEVYANGYNGYGQTILIVDAYGSPTIWADAAQFASQFGLVDALSGVAYSSYTAHNSLWNQESTLDVEYANAVAQGASIILWVAEDGSTSGLYTALWQAISSNWGYQISLSWGWPEKSLSVAQLNQVDVYLSAAAAMGISVNTSSGDCGDYVTGYAAECQTGIVQVESPASDPWATAVGGTSLIFASGGRGGTFPTQTGWGNNLTQISYTWNSFWGTYPPVLPPDLNGFLEGAGGGDSSFWPEPSWQASNGMTGKRHVPDIAYLADPYTGVQIIESFDGGGFTTESIAGTSLAAPMFTALWAISNEWALKNNRAETSLGLASELMYDLPNAVKGHAPAITDINESRYSSLEKSDVTGTVVRAFSHQNYDRYALAAPLGKGVSSSGFLSALWQEPDSSWWVLTFGTDYSTLYTGPGWDNVTGLGVPNGWNFVTAFSVVQWCTVHPPYC